MRKKSKQQIKEVNKKGRICRKGTFDERFLGEGPRRKNHHVIRWGLYFDIKPNFKKEFIIRKKSERILFIKGAPY